MNPIAPGSVAIQSNASQDRRLRPHADVVVQRLGSTGVVVELRSGAIFELNATALRIWELLAAGASRAEILERLATEFGASESAIHADVDEMLARFSDAGLLES